MQEFNSLNLTDSIDHENLNIFIRPRPPRRCQSGVSIVPFRPYVKCLTSERQLFSFANGKDSWITSGEKQTFFKQENARCIGSLIEDCDISDVIRWDIEGESTRLPMMCKLWIIVDGAVVERGTPHLVQDAAMQISISGRNYRSILENEQQYKKVTITKIDRRRRHSWHDVNEYHSVPYYQYTRTVKSGIDIGIQCNMDNEHLISIQQYLPHLKEETVDENYSISFQKETAQELIHKQLIPQNRVQISIMTQTEHHEYVDQSTTIESDFIELFNLNIQTNENILSSIVNPSHENLIINNQNEIITNFYNGKFYTNRSISTGDDYPEWWVRLSTNIILSDHITNQGEEKFQSILLPSPRQQDQSIQTINEQDLEIDLHTLQSLSTVTINNHYEIIDDTDDGNNSHRLISLTNPQHDLDSHLRQTRPSSKQSDSDYHTLSLNQNQKSFSISDQQNIQQSFSSSIETHQRTRTESTATSVLSTLCERYERTLRDRQKPIAIINDQSLDVNYLINYYRQKLQKSISDQSNKTIEGYDTTSSELLLTPRLTKEKYRQMANLTSEEMLYGSVPSPRIEIQNPTIITPRKRHPRFDYCDLHLTDHKRNSAWIRYNEERIEELQKRIDLMLQLDDNEEAQLLLLSSSSYSTKSYIDDYLLKKSKRRNQIINYHNRIFSPRRYDFRLPYRLNQSRSPRLLTRNLTRSTYPTTATTKSVRISTNDDIKPIRKSSSHSRPVIPILRRHNHTNSTLQSRRLVDPTHVWKSNADGKFYILEQFSIPRYYRLYTDVSFREIYHFSRLIEPYLQQKQSNHRMYSTLVKNFALYQQLPTITTVA